MVQSIQAQDVTLRTLRQNFGLQLSTDPNFFSEWAETHPTLSSIEQVALDRVKTNFVELMEDPPMLENSVKLVVLAPLLDLAGFYHRPFRIETEPGISLETIDEETVIRGRIDVLVLKNRLWLLVIESKRSDFSVTRAVPQALSYMLSNPMNPLEVKPTFGMITNGNEFLFLKSLRPEYANSRLFSLVNPGNELYGVLQILRRLGHEVIG